MHTMRKGCITILIGCIFYDQGMKQINSCLIERYKLSHNFILTTLVGNGFFPLYSQGGATSSPLWYARLLTQKVSSAEQLQAFHFLKVN